MRDYVDWVDLIAAEIRASLHAVSADEVAACRSAIGDARRVFVGGKGRSGWLMRAAAIRLMHLGLHVHVIDEATTPSIAAGDLLLLASGSGRTPSVVGWAEKGRAAGARVALITAQPGSPAGQVADVLVQIAAPSKGQSPDGRGSGQIMANLFEQSLLVLLDIMTMQLMQDIGQDEAAMFARHANLE